MPGHISTPNGPTPNSPRMMSMSPSPDLFMPSRNANARQKYKRLDSATETNGYYTRSRRRNSHSDDSSKDDNGVLKARVNNSRPSRNQSPILSRSQSRTKNIQSPAFARSRSGSLTPRQTLIFGQSPDPKKLDALAEYSGGEDEEENAAQDEDEGYESPTKRLSDYSDDSTVSWLIERQLKGNIDASLALAPEQRKSTREKTPDVIEDRSRTGDRRTAGVRDSPATSKKKNVTVVDNIPTLKPISEKEEKVEEPEPGVQESETTAHEARAVTDTSKKDEDTLEQAGRKCTPSQGFINPKTFLAISTIILLSIPAIIFQDTLRLVPAYICSKLDLPPSQYIPPTYSPNPNSSHYFDALNRLSSEVDRRISHITRDLFFLKNEWSQKLPILKELTEAFHQIPEASIDPLAIPKVNFLSPGMGARVDRDMTSPTRYVLKTDPFSRILRFFTSEKHTNGPESVLETWNDVGDCWCSPMSHNGMQITIELGKAIVPEEIIVEHIPQSATLDSGSTPKDLELWVQYIFQDPETPPGSLTGALISYDAELAKGAREHHGQHQTPKSACSAAEMIFSTLQSSFSSDPPSDYTDDPLLGPSFFRVAKWRYDIDGTYHVQSYVPDAVIDVPRVRAVQTVFRTATTWGDEDMDAPYVCLYRLRLHGHT